MNFNYFDDRPINVVFEEETMEEAEGNNSENSSIHDSEAPSDIEDDPGVNRSDNLFSDADEGGSSGSDDEEDAREDDTVISGACEWSDISNYSPLQIPEYPEDEELLIRPESTHPCDLLRLFLTDEVIDLIVRETNRYAEQTILLRRRLQPRARINDWRPVTAEEIFQFIGVLLCMGLNQQPSIKDYWSSKSKLFGCALIKETMTRDRFQAILTNIHFADNDTADMADPLCKLRSLCDLLNSRFKEVLKPGARLVVDESMRKWRGRLRFRIYNPNKSDKYGIKLYKLTTVGSYVLGFKIYCGAEEAKELPPSRQVIIDLCEPYLDEGRVVFADNFYSTVPLVEWLANRSTLYCGTVRRNRRDLPPEVVNANLKKGEATGQQCQHGTKVINWRDKRNVLMISSVFDHDATLSLPDGEIKTAKPPSILHYNDAKKGIDVHDQMGSYHDFNRKGVKWYRKLALDLIVNSLVLNAWVLQKHVTPKPIGIVQFRTEIALKLLEAAATAPDALPRKRSHTLTIAEGTVNSNGKRCKRCYTNHRRNLSRTAATRATKKTLTYCDLCPGQPNLCLPCFNACHASR